MRCGILLQEPNEKLPAQKTGGRYKGNASNITMVL
jgi:hypothetical protein